MQSFRIWERIFAYINSWHERYVENAVINTILSYYHCVSCERYLIWVSRSSFCAGLCTPAGDAALGRDVSTSNHTCKFALIDASMHPATRTGVGAAVFDPSRAIISSNYELSASPLVRSLLPR